MLHDRETTLLRGAARLRSGDASAVDAIVTVLRELTADDWRLTRSVGQILKFPSEDVQVFGVLALAKMGERAAGEVPAIVEVMRTGRATLGGPAAAAVYALGTIGTPEAVEAVTEWISTRSIGELVEVSSQLGSFGVKGAPFLKFLTAASRDPSVDEYSRARLKAAANEIRVGLKHLYGATMERIRGSEELICLDTVARGDDVDAHLAPHQASLDPTLEGLVVDTRFKFRLNLQSGELRVKIYGDGTGRHLVVLIADGQSYGVSPTNGAEIFASALTHIYGLDPSRTTWLEHYAESCGYGDAKTEQITFDYNADRNLLDRPTWQIKTSLTAALREWGIEL